MKTTKNTDGSAWMTFMVPSCSDTGAEENVLPKPMLEELLQQRPNLKMVTLMEPLVGQLCNNTAFKADAYVDIDLKIQTKAGPVKIPGKARCCKRRKELATTRRNAKRPTLGGQGAKAIFPFKYELLAFMKDVRREEHILTSMHMVTFMKRNHGEWLASYRTGKRDAYKSLLKLCQEFAKRHCFSQRVACFTKMPTPDMLEIRQDFACKFWTKYHAYAASEIMNVDETAVYYDMPPGKIWAEIGKSSKVDKKQKHSDRITAVLTCRADGSKLPILFIVHGVPGGTIDEVELDTYPEEHYYSVQESAWVDSRVWKAYLEILPPYIEGPTVIVADNFDAHVTQESANVIAGDLHSVLEPLPANCTSVCQPLDVGVMGPFKKLLRTLWLDEAPVTSAADKRREKLPLLIIVKGTPGGDIKRFEVPTYPPEPVYAVQEKAYMDQRVWSMYCTFAKYSSLRWSTLLHC
ncbi:hypothetical protein DYB35_012360 [Aphanomyces astaci]|uniref:DDE-1 domain-containing protein n=1 Tax=Aphanomyces astaci TaxID=112090 RepID=A0A418DWU9_APHAT|nr:hypothetical protein DYB35_012360 [Aphanomyces astaci]